MIDDDETNRVVREHVVGDIADDRDAKRKSVGVEDGQGIQAHPGKHEAVLPPPARAEEGCVLVGCSTSCVVGTMMM